LVREFRAECKLLRKLRHPNIIMFMAACTRPPNLCVVTELLSGSLFDLLHNSQVKLSWKQRLLIALDTAKGMNFLHLHKPPIIHRGMYGPPLSILHALTISIDSIGIIIHRVM
jgi:serine/threonine protein kinase